MLKSSSKVLLSLLLWALLVVTTDGQFSRARYWNENLLEAIRTDEARPTVHARNLFHISAAMYDAWAAYDADASTYFLGKSHRGFYIPFDGVVIPTDETEIEYSRELALCYAAYRLIRHRFQFSPNREQIYRMTDQNMSRAGIRAPYLKSVDYKSDGPAALGNYIAEQIIAYGLTDGSNERNRYENRHYKPVNPPILPERTGTNGLVYRNRWQELQFDEIEFVGQSGIKTNTSIIPFLSPEWGIVTPFSLTEEDLTIYNKNGEEYWVYHDPGPPAYLDSASQGEISDYQWGFSLVAHWSSHLDPADSVMWDISPASIGNISFDQFPKTHDELRDFYDLENGGDIGTGYDLNPKTSLPYEPQIVPRGDYARVLAEFWADGPHSETPPGHWFTLLNYVSYHPDQQKQFKGTEPMNQLEWDVKAYFALGGAMHDAAISVWGIKGYYDYIRPISAIRGMCELGQCTNPSVQRYDPQGVPLDSGFIQLSRNNPSLLNLPSIRSWRVVDSFDQTGGVDWIFGEDWMPYQRPSFVTPPFAGYVSGHSTFSRAAAKVLALFTGDEYFPGGMGEFVARKNDFLVFEEGPSTDVILQWAKYTDASDQCSLSRIWGGIHPPIDDIPGRIIGEEIGVDAFAFAERYFNGEVVAAERPSKISRFVAGPNPVQRGDQLTVFTKKYDEFTKRLILYDSNGRIVFKKVFSFRSELSIDTSKLNPGLYVLVIDSNKYREELRIAVN